jgi:hypothetical protein
VAAVLRDQDVVDTGAGATDADVTLTSIQAGDLLVVCFRERDGGSIAGLSVISDLDGAFAQVVTRANNAARVWIGALLASSAGTHVITIDYGGPSVVFDANASGWGGIESGTADTTNNTGGGATTSHNHGSVTPSASALIITCWGCSGDNNGETPGADGMTALTNTASIASDFLGKQYYQYKVGHTGAIDGDFTTADSVAFDGVIAAFLESEGEAETITLDKWQNTMPAAHKRVHGVVTSGLTPPNRFGS